MKVISVVMAKGGVSKTSLLTNISTLLHQKGKRTLMIDTDSQANATTCMGVKNVKYSLYDCLFKNIPHSDAVISTPHGNIIGSNIYLADLEEALFLKKVGKDKVLSNFLEQQVKPLGVEYVLIDTPPHYGNVLINVLMASDFCITPLIPSELSMEGITQFSEIFDAVKIENAKLDILGVIFAMVNPRTREYKRLHGELKQIFQDKLLDFYIPIDQRVIDSQSSNNFSDKKAVPCVKSFPNSKASIAYNKLADLILSEV